MELLPTSAPVYGGGLIVAFLPEDCILPDDNRTFLVFKGSKQRQVTEAKISLEDNALHAVIPDHEPPECVMLSAYIQLQDGDIQCLASEEFTYYLDQTCYLARYLADSIHDLESLEDWDNIRGENFSLESEDFGSLDERLTSAFQHLILPLEWNLLGNSVTELVPRETLFHFAARLGLSTFVTFLLEKPGAEACLHLRNQHNELAKDIALARRFDGLADLITDPHAHGVIKWESKEEIGHAIILTRHSFGTVSTNAEKKNNSWPPLNTEIEALSRSSGPPDTPIPYQLDSAWNADELETSLSFPQQTDGEASTNNFSSKQRSTGVTSPHQGSTNVDNEVFLADNLQHLHGIGDQIQYLRRKDMDRLHQEEDEALARLSSSCPDLAQDLFTDSVAFESTQECAPSTASRPRTRNALPTDMEQELESQPLQDEVSFPTLERRHSWHSIENLARDLKDSSHPSLSASDGEDSDDGKKLSALSPTVVKRKAHGNLATFSVVQAPPSTPPRDSKVDDGRRTSSLLCAGTDVQGEADRRSTISEGVATRSTKFGQTHLIDSDQRPPVPTRPPKKLMTRKLSFLEKMRNSARSKPKEKGRMRTFAELKFGSSKHQEINEESFGANDDLKDLDGIKRRSILSERPKSTMISRQPQYPVAASSGTFSLPSNAARFKPTPNLGALQNANDVNESSQARAGCEEEDGITSRFYYSTKHNSGSCESLDEVALDSELESDPDLLRRLDDADSWSSSLDKKAIKKLSLSKKDVKRQENIFEFILTERNHLTTLKIMQLIYKRGLINDVGADKATIDKLFPLIDDHVEFVSQFVQQLTERQNINKVVSGIGDTLIKQWEGSNGVTMKRLFGDFCSKQNEITSFYKELLKSDKKFQAFVKKCDKNPLARRQDVLGCALLITQRLTKYPIMLQTMLENSNKKDHKDYHQLERALELSREIAKDVDEQVQMHEREILLMETYDKIESKSATTLLKDVFFLLLTDCIVMLQENNGRFTFPSGQPAAVPLQKMIVREVANDEKALYLMSMRTQQMYTLKLSTADHCKTLTNKIRLAIGKCPDEDEGATSEEEGERRGHDQRMDKAKQMIKQLELTDQRIIRTLEEKMSFFRALAETSGRGSLVADLHFSFPEYSTGDNFPPGTPILLKAIGQVNKLTHAFYGPDGSSCHSINTSEHESGSRSGSSLPKRSDTFGGFDNGKEPSSARVIILNSSQSDSKLADLEQSKDDLASSNRDSGFHSQLMMTQAAGSQNSLGKSWDPLSKDRLLVPHIDETPPADSYIPPTSDQVAALTTLAQILCDYQSFAAQQDTYVEKLRLQLLGKKRSTGGGLQEAELKRNQIKQQEQMDDLRKQQQQLRNERDQWQRQVERFQRSFDNEKLDFEQEKKQILQEKEENEKQRAEIQKAKDDYQREVARLRALQRQTQQEMHTSSSASTLTSNKNNNNASESSSSKLLATSRSHSSLQVATDLHDLKHPSSPIFSESDYPRTYPLPKREAPVSSTTQPQLPIHMQYSIVNQQAAVQRPKAQDVSKLASKLATTKAGNIKSTSSDRGPFQQLIPGRLSKLSGQPHSNPSSKKHHIV